MQACHSWCVFALVLFFGFGAYGTVAFAQPTPSEVESLKKQLSQMEEQLRQLRQKIAELEAKPPATKGPEPDTGKSEDTTEQRLRELERQVQQQRAASRGILAPFNPKISLNGLFTAAAFSDKDNLNFGDHDPRVNGFNVQNVELHLQGTVDPYFQMDANLVTFIEKGDTKFELEEAYGTSLALPANRSRMASCAEVMEHDPFKMTPFNPPLHRRRLCRASGCGNS